MSLVIKDGNGVSQTLKSTPDGGEEVVHHNIDYSELPVGAATAAAQATHTATLAAIQTAVEATQAELEVLNATGQASNFGASLMTFDTEAATPVATNGAAAAITAAPAGGKKLAIDRIEFFETDAGAAGTNDGRPAANDLLIVQLQEETTGIIVFRRPLRVTAAKDQEHRWFEIVCPRPIKLSTADKKLFVRLYAQDSGGTAKVRNLTGQINVWYHSED